MRLKAVEGIIIGRMVKHWSFDPQSLDFGKELYASGNMVKKDIKVKQGVDKDTAKKVVKIIKDTGLKVQASIMDEQSPSPARRSTTSRNSSAFWKSHRSAFQCSTRISGVDRMHPGGA